MLHSEPPSLSLSISLPEMRALRQVIWEEWGPVYPLISAYALGTTIVMLSLTSCTDPGYIPRQKQVRRRSAAARRTGRRAWLKSLAESRRRRRRRRR